MKYFFILAILLAGVMPVLAQDNTSNASRPDIEELLVVMRVQKLSENAMIQAKGMMAGVLKQSGVPMDASDKAKEMQDKTFGLIEQEMSWDKMKPEYIKVYAAVYTPADVKQLIAFYKSPVGQMLLDKQPLLIQQTMDMTRRRMTEIMPKLQQLLKEESGARGDDAEGSSGDSDAFKGDHREAATRVLEDLRLLDSATDQYAIETNKTTGMHPTFSDLKNYLKTGTRLYNTGADVFGVPYGPFTVDSVPQVGESTFNALSDVADPSFWSPF
jgi:hypothetical protein